MRSVVCCVGVVALAAGAAEGQSRLVGSQTSSNASQRILVEINRTDGSWAPIGPLSDFFVMGLAYDSARDVLYGSGTQGLFRINYDTGATTLLNTVSGLSFPYGLAYDGTRDVLYVSDGFSQGRIGRLNRTTGVVSDVVNVGDYGGFEGLAYSASRDRIFALADDPARVLVINPVSFVVEELPLSLPSANWRGLEYDAASDSLFVTIALGGGGSLHRISLSGTPTISLAGATAPTVQGLAIIPSPGGVALLGGLAVAVRRRRG